MAADPASFRDPAGQVIHADGRIFRAVSQGAIEQFEFARANARLQKFIAEGGVVDSREVGAENSSVDAPAGARLYEHPRLPFISYPYEWSFSLLKRAALHHLDLQIALLPSGVSLCDATAYNIQFTGVRPIFIDALSFRRYEEGEYWTAHRQFCEQFLNPLLLRALLGVAHNDWFRGALEGVPTPALAQLIPYAKRLSWRLIAHVFLPAQLQARGDAERTRRALARPLPKSAYLGMLHQLRDWIAGLSPKGGGKTQWSDYAENNSYRGEEFEIKRRIVGDFARRAAPRLLLDLGCNTGVYSELALEHGAKSAIGFDADHGALERAYARAVGRKIEFLPLYQDAANPSPCQGWAGEERRGLARRCDGAEALIALAFVHHLAIGRNVPLERFASWLVGLAPKGVVEFVPKDDPMARRLLALRKDIFPDYNFENFKSLIARSARIVGVETVTASGRALLVYDRT